MDAMDAAARRERILRDLHAAEGPLAATRFAQALGVSRQVIVGDIALLRAQGHEIIATTRGYTVALAPAPGRYIRKLACQHSLEDTEAELRCIIEHGGTVLDVIVEHRLYGEITGQLNISTDRDVESFLAQLRLGEARLLAELTGGVHLHTIACRDAETFAAIRETLAAKGLLYAAE